MNIVKRIIQKNAVTYLRSKDSTGAIHQDTLIEICTYIDAEYENILKRHNVVYLDRDVECAEMKARFKDDNTLYISKINNDSPIFTPEMNLKFRAVHDMVHIQMDYACDYEGEYNTYLLQSVNMSNDAKQVLFSEIVLQACYFLHYGIFPKQKIVLTAIPNPTYNNPYLLLDISHNFALSVRLSQAGRKYLKELMLNEGGYHYNELWALLLTHNEPANIEFEHIEAHTIGALTDAPIIGLNGLIWYFADYQIVDEISELLKSKIITFTFAGF